MISILPVLLGDKQAVVYQAALELGTATVQQIARQANLPRSTCYLILNELEATGLISKAVKGKKKYIVVENPDRLEQLLQDRKQQLENVNDELSSELPELQALYNAHPQKPAVRYYEGFEGVKTILEDSLQAKEILVLCSGYDTPMETKMEQYIEDYFQRSDKLGIRTLEIIGGSQDAQEYLEQYNGPLHEIKIAPLYKGVAHIDKMIYSNKLAIVSYEYLNGVVIENEQIVEFERVLFERLWDKT